MTVHQSKAGYPSNDMRAGAVLAREKALTAETHRKAARQVAAQSVCALDCAELLAMLGLTATMGKGKA